MKVSKTMKWVGILLLPLSLSAETVSWLQGADGKWDGDWSDKTRWSTGALPTATDKVVFPALGSTITITVNDTYTIGSLDMDATGDAAEQRYEFCLSGTGTINLAGSDGNVYSTWVRDRRALTLDGVSLIDTGTQDLMIRGRITVKNGALLKNTRLAKLLYYDSECIIDGGRFEFSEFQYNGADEGTSAPWPMRLVLNGGSISGGHVYSSGGTKPFSIEINGGEMNVSSYFGLQNEGSVLKMMGGSLKVMNERFIIGAGTSLVLTDGALQFPNVNSVDAAANVSLTGGVLTLGAVTEDPRFNGVAGVTLKYDLGWSDYVKSGAVPVSADSIRLERFQTDADVASVLHGKFRNIIFTTGSEPFRFGNGNQRHFYLQGPTTIRAEADQADNVGSTWYTHLEGDFVVDTCDAKDGATPRHLSLWSTASRWGTASLTVRGCGSLCLLQHDSCSTFRFIDVQAGATLNLSKRGNGTEWGPVSTERFTLGANSKVTLDAKYNHIVAETFEIDPTATIEVMIGDVPTCGAFAILQSPNGTTPSAAYMSQISLKGSTDGWSLKAEDGQITLYKAGTVTGDYPTEWVGKGADDKVGTLANFYSALPTESIPVYFGADETRLTASWGGPLGDGGYTLGGVWFLETAVNTFGYISLGETGYNEPFFCSYSGVPQKHLEGSFRTPFLQMATRGHGPLVFEGTTQNWGGNYFYDVTKPESDWSYWQWSNRGDCRINKALFNMRNFAFYGMDSGYGNYSRFTVLANSVVDVQDLYSELTGSATGFRVEEGGLLKFTDTLVSAHQGERRYKWTVSPAGQIVNGTMDVQIPFVGGATQAYGGRGTLKLASTVPSTAASRVWLMDTLTTELASDWQTVTAASDTPLALGAIAGNPVVKVPDGWRYEAGAATATAAADRAIEIRENASLTIDADNGEATVAEPVVGPGALKVAAGTALTLSADGNTAPICLKSGSTLAVVSSMTVGPLAVEDGAKVTLAPNAVLTVNGDVTLAGATFDFTDAMPSRWTTVLICSGGTVTGGEYEDQNLKRRVVTDELGRQVVQCKVQSGMIILIR